MFKFIAKIVARAQLAQNRKAAGKVELTREDKNAIIGRRVLIVAGLIVAIVVAAVACYGIYSLTTYFKMSVFATKVTTAILASILAEFLIHSYIQTSIVVDELAAEEIASHRDVWMETGYTNDELIEAVKDLCNKARRTRQRHYPDSVSYTF